MYMCISLQQLDKFTGNIAGAKRYSGPGNRRVAGAMAPGPPRSAAHDAIRFELHDTGYGLLNRQGIAGPGLVD